MHIYIYTFQNQLFMKMKQNDKGPFPGDKILYPQFIQVLLYPY